MGTPELLDTTLREGEQCCGVFFPIETKVRLALLLDRIGVDFIEVGHPAAAPSIRQAAAEIARLDLRARRIGHARLVREEIRLVRDLGLPWVGIFSGINALSRERYRLSRRHVLDRIAEAVRYAKDIGLSVRFTCEDASRTDPADLAELFAGLREQGVDRLSYADTVGTDTPESLERLHRRIVGAVPFDTLHFHFHDDRGTALANALKAAELGAQCIDASILGIGERAGLVRLENMVRLRAGGSFRRECDRRREDVLALAKGLVASSIDLCRYQQRRFAHKSGVHIHGVLRDPAQYEHTDPALSGSRRLIVLSKLIGRSGLRMLLSRYGFETGGAGLERLLAKIKSEDRLELTEPQEIVRYFERCSCTRSIAPSLLVY